MSSNLYTRVWVHDVRTSILNYEYTVYLLAGQIDEFEPLFKGMSTDVLTRRLNLWVRTSIKKYEYTCTYSQAGPGFLMNLGNRNSASFAAFARHFPASTMSQASVVTHNPETRKHSSRMRTARLPTETLWYPRKKRKVLKFLQVVRVLPHRASALPLTLLMANIDLYLYKPDQVSAGADPGFPIGGRRQHMTLPYLAKMCMK